MTIQHKNKTLATFLSFPLGGLGAHRFYLYGKNDAIAWLHFASLPLSYFLSKLYFNLDPFITYLPFMLSLLVAVISALVLGLRSDEKWDEKLNPNSGKQSDSSWLLALILVLDVGAGAIILIGMMARAFDLLYTGGAYG
ncbi:MAG: TM2 domain-containing protein [Burkholderiales bacterium]|nr:TM2 domain-containing protein [Burkholderiales bacterium]